MLLLILLLALLACGTRVRAFEAEDALEACIRRLRAVLGAASLAGSLSPASSLLSPERRRDLEASLAGAEECLSLIRTDPGPKEWTRASRLAERLAELPQRRALAAYCRKRAALLRRERLRQVRRTRWEAFAAAAGRVRWLLLVPALLAAYFLIAPRLTRPFERERTRTPEPREEAASTGEDSFWYTPEEDDSEEDGERYREAVALYEDGDYGEAMDIFEDLDGYKNSDELAESARRRLEEDDVYEPDYEPDDDYGEDLYGDPDELY